MSISQTVVDGQSWAIEYVAVTFENSIRYLNALTAAAENAADTAGLSGAPLDDATLVAKIAEFLNGQFTGIPTAVENQLWDRAREKSNTAMQGAITAIDRQLSAAGWEQPIGASVARKDRATQDAALEISDNARQVAITQANIIIENIRAAMQIELQRVIADSNITLEILKSNLAMVQNKFQYLMEAAKAGAQISAQQMASAISSLSFNSSMSTSQSASTSQGHSISHKGSAGDGPFLTISG